MRLCGLSVLVAITLALLPARGATTNAAPDFKEVYDLVRAHLKGVSEAELNQAAVDGFLASLRGKVTLIGPAERPTAVAALARSTLLESNVAYVRLAGFDDQLPKRVSEALNQWGASNALAGLVLDLRFARSEDYASVAALADLFQSKARPLLDFGQGPIQSREKPDAVRLPVTVLVNRETSGAAEAFAALVRETGVGLLLGGTTAGNALLGEEFSLKDGRRLRVATKPVKVGDGIELSPRGVTPDIIVSASLVEERLWLDDPYGSNLRTNNPTLGGGTGGGPTNRVVRRPRVNEADLVRARREGVALDAEFLEGRETEPVRPVIRDAVLARAVDLLKGLAVVRSPRS